MSPAAEAVVYQSSAGWYTSAEKLDDWELDFAVHFNGLFMPEKKKNNKVLNSDYATFDIQGAKSAVIPTALGGASAIVFQGELQFDEERIPFEFDALEGIDMEMMPHAFVQATLGLPVLGDLSMRWLPTLDIGDVRFGTYGVGLKHNISQYFGHSRPQNFQVAALVAYSDFRLNYEFEPLSVQGIAEMREIEVEADIWLLQLVGSLKLWESNWSAFASAGAANSNFNYLVGGEGIALPVINSSLGSLGANKSTFKGDVGITYQAGGFLVSSMFSQGAFSNLNLSLHFRL